MSGPLTTASGGGFQQSGQVDWVSLSKSTFTFGLDVLVRLSKAELHPATTAIGLIIFGRFALNTESQRRIHDALSNLKSFSSYGKLVWFGFGIRPIIKDLADSEQGMACVALCACMSVSYDTFFAAGVLRELCKQHEVPPDLLPSIHQWKTLVDICAGTLSHSKFPVLLEGMIRCVLPTAEISLIKPTSKEALVKALVALADVSTGKLETVTIAGGLDCIWLAAVSEWLLSLDVKICSLGKMVYESTSNNRRRPTVTIMFTSDHEESLHLSKCYHVPNGLKFFPNGLKFFQSSPEQHAFAGGRSEWDNILADSFGRYFYTLIDEDIQRDFAFFLFRNAQLADEYYRYGPDPDKLMYDTARYHRFLRRTHFSHLASKARPFSSFASHNLPELAEISRRMKDYEIESHADPIVENHRTRIRSRCMCQWCKAPRIPHYDSQPHCLLIVAETIFIFLWILSAIEKNPSLRPSPWGLRSLYSRFQLRIQFEQDNPHLKGNTSSADALSYTVDILTAALILFSGSDNSGTMATDNPSAICGNGVCAYFKAFEDLNLLPEEASAVKVVPGHIDFEGAPYRRICDVFDFRFPKSDLGPRPDYKLLVQETSQSEVITATYKLSCNMESENSLLGISELQEAITKSIRGPVQCTELCGRRPNGAQGAIVLGPENLHLARDILDLSLGTPPFLRQWSVLSKRNRDIQAIQLSIMQTVIYRLYLEIVHQDSYHLAFLDVCQACYSTASVSRESKKGTALSPPDLDSSPHWSPEATIIVSSLSESRSWVTKEYHLFGIPRVDTDEGQILIADAEKAFTSAPGGKNAQTRPSEPVLYKAARLGYEGIAQLLLDGGAIIDERASDERVSETALHVAAENGQNEVVRILLGRGARVNVKDSGGLTPLERAVHRGMASTINLLISYKVGGDSYDTWIQRALVWAADRGDFTVVQRLLQQQADVNATATLHEDTEKMKYKRTALQSAAEGGHLAVVEQLLEAKADVNAAPDSIKGRTALQAAVEGGHIAVVERLLQEKADVNAAAARKDGRTALQAAAERGHLALVERLLQEKANVNAIGRKKRTALQDAAAGGHLAVVKRLLQENADVNAKDYLARTALHEAAAGGHLAVVERLLQEKADVNAIDHLDRTALREAAAGEHLAVVERLLREKADVDVRDNCGKTALQEAVARRHLAVVKRLLQEKADVNVLDEHGRTVLQAAEAEGHDDVVEILRKFGTEN